MFSRRIQEEEAIECGDVETAYSRDQRDFRGRSDSRVELFAAAEAPGCVLFDSAGRNARETFKPDRPDRFADIC